MTAPTEVLDILRQGREVLADESRWTRGCMARRANGLAVPSTSEDACSWCSWGAVLRFSRVLTPMDTEAEERAYTAYRWAMHLLAIAGGGDPIRWPEFVADYNDSLTSHADLLAWWDKAIELACQPEPVGAP